MAPVDQPLSEEEEPLGNAIRPAPLPSEQLANLRVRGASDYREPPAGIFFSGRLSRGASKLFGRGDDVVDVTGASRLSRIGLVFSTVSALRTEVRAKASQQDLRDTMAFLAEFSQYLIFLIALLVVATNMNGLPDAYPLTRNVKELVLGDPPHAFDSQDQRSEAFLLYEGVSTAEEMWEYLQTQLGAALFADESVSESEAALLFGGAVRKIGAMRLVTTRVRPTWDACVELPVFRDFSEEPSIETCFPRPTSVPASWSDEPFGTPDSYFAIDPSLFDQDRIGRSASTQNRRGLLAPLVLPGADVSPAAGGRRRLRAGGGGGGGGRRGVSAGAAGDVYAPEDKLFKMDLRSNMRRPDWQAEMDRLRMHNYVDRQTRVVELLFTVYSVSANLYVCATIDLMVPYTGGVHGIATFYTLSPVRHLMFLTPRAKDFPPPRTSDVFKLIAEALFILLVLHSLVWQMSKAVHVGRSVAADASKMESDGSWMSRGYNIALAAVHGLQHVQVWSLMQFAALIMHLVVVSKRWDALNQLVALELNPAADEFVDFHKVADSMYEIQNIVAINVLFSFLSLFKFATVVPQLSMLNRTMMAAFNDLAGFLFLFGVMFLGFMQAFQLMFGMDLLGFASAGESFYSLFALLSGDVNLDELRASNRFLGPLLFLAYAVVVVFILLNMFVAIVTKAYRGAKKELREDPQTGKLFNTIRYTTAIITQLARKQYKFLVLALRSKKTQREINQAIQDGVVTPRELREILRTSGLAERNERFPSWRYWSNADLVMKRYDPDGNGWLSRDELLLLQVDMENESEERKRILESLFAEADEETRIVNECERRRRVHSVLSRKADALAAKHTKLLSELSNSRQTILAHLNMLTQRLWKIWEHCDVI